MTTPTTTPGQSTGAEPVPEGGQAAAPPPRRARNLLVELLVIVAGVLIALTLEGLWGWIAGGEAASQ